MDLTLNNILYISALKNLNPKPFGLLVNSIYDVIFVPLHLTHLN